MQPSIDRTRISTPFLPALRATVVLALIATRALAGGWSTNGGGAAHSGLSSEVGPTTPDPLWSTTVLSSAVPIFVEGDRVFLVTDNASSTAIATVIALDLDTGGVAWSTPIPGGPPPYHGWCMGADQGLVLATHGDTIQALSAATGAPVWQAAQTFVPATIVGAHLYTGMRATFARGGDAIVDAIESVIRISAVDGSTVWTLPRPSGAQGGTGVALGANRLYEVESTSAGMQVVALDPVTGSPLYASALVPANGGGAPFLGPDGAIHVRVASFVGPILPPPAPPPQVVDQILTLDDTGTALVPRWTSAAVPIDTVLGCASAPDGSLLRLVHGFSGIVLERLDGATGLVTDTSAVLVNGPGTFQSAPIVVDALGRAFIAIQGTGVIALESDLSLMWSSSLGLANQGASALGRDGTLVTGSLGAVHAFRAPRTSAQTVCAGDTNACPCLAGASGSGCPNSAFATGARLATDGVASVSSDTLLLRALALPDSACLFLQGTTALTGGVGVAFGDGLRCAGGNVTRLSQRLIANATSSLPDAMTPMPLSQLGNVAAGDVRTYQVWYRNAAPYCTIATFNLTNGVTLTWSP